MITRIPSTSRDYNFIKRQPSSRNFSLANQGCIGFAAVTTFRHDNISWCFADDSDLRIRSQL